MRGFFSTIACIVFLGSISFFSEAELTIVLTEGQDNPISIGIVPFGTAGGIPQVDIAKVIASDLYRSGEFKPFPVNDMMSRPFRQEDVFYKDWKLLNVEYLIIGHIEKNKLEDRYDVSYELHDIAKGVKIFSSKAFAKERHLRGLAHHVSDRVYEKLTGLRGAFSTQLIYVTIDRKEGEETRYRLQYADSDGHRVRTIRKSKEPIMSPSWSPDGKKVAYVSYSEGKAAIILQELQTGVKYKLTDYTGINGAPSWSPDGRYMAMVLSKDGNPEIYIMEMKTKVLRRLTNNSAIDTEPRWLPDGKGIIFTSDRGGSVQIYQINIASKKVKRLTFQGRYNARPGITPDGRHLIMVHRDQDRRFHIAVQDLKRGTFNIVTGTELDESPSIAPNGTMLIYATLDEKGKGVLGFVSIDGKVKLHLPLKGGDIIEPAWSPFPKR